MLSEKFIKFTSNANESVMKFNENAWKIIIIENTKNQYIPKNYLDEMVIENVTICDKRL